MYTPPTPTRRNSTVSSRRRRRCVFGFRFSARDKFWKLVFSMCSANDLERPLKVISATGKISIIVSAHNSTYTVAFCGVFFITVKLLVEVEQVTSAPACIGDPASIIWQMTSRGCETGCLYEPAVHTFSLFKNFFHFCWLNRGGGEFCSFFQCFFVSGTYDLVSIVLC